VQFFRAWFSNLAVFVRRGGGGDLTYSAYNLGAASTFVHHVARAFAHFPASHTGLLAAGMAE
jgi:hypothetical protein